MKTRLEPVLITLDYPPDHGGVARYLAQLVEASEGRLRVLAPPRNGVEDKPGVKRTRMFWKVWPKWWPMVWLCRQQPMNRILLVSHVFPVGTAAWLSKLLGGPDYAVFFHGLDLKLARSAWKKWLLRRIVRRSKAVFVNSEMTKGLLKDLEKRCRNLNVITPGVERHAKPNRSKARRELGLDDSIKLVVTVTRLVPRKGVDTAITAVANLQRKVDFTYCVVGHGSDRDRLHNLAEVTGARVSWVEEADDAEKWRWLEAADVFVMPVREAEDDVEGFGIVFLEAALAGVPSIAGRSGGAPEAVVDGKTGVLVDPTKPEETEAALRDLLENQEKREWLGLKARQRAEERFGWPERWEQIVQALGLDE